MTCKPQGAKSHGDECECEVCAVWKARISVAAIGNMGKSAALRSVLSRVLDEAGRGQPLTSETVADLRQALAEIE